MGVRVSAIAIASLAMLAGSGCTEAKQYRQALCVLVDVSGTYADERPQVVDLLKREILPAMVPGDTLIVVRIDSQSYEKDNLEALVTLDARPSRANAQKLAIARSLDAFAKRAHRSEWTDIPGAMMLGAEYLREIDAGSKVLLLFSDLEEDLPAGARRELGAAEFDGIHVVALNVKRLGRDAADPARFRERLARWRERVARSGGLAWRTFLDPARLRPWLEAVREGRLQAAPEAAPAQPA